MYATWHLKGSYKARDSSCHSLDRVPLQYLTGSAHWRDFVLAVGPGVLIPRPETELMIDFAREVRSHKPSESHVQPGPVHPSLRKLRSERLLFTTCRSQLFYYFTRMTDMADDD